MRSLAILRLWNIEASTAALLIELDSAIVAAFADISTWSSETILNSPTFLLVFHDLSTFAVALLSHSEQGSQYTSELFQCLLSAHGVTCSMSRSGNCWDNAAMESFFSTLTIERTISKCVKAPIYYGAKSEEAI